MERLLPPVEPKQPAPPEEHLEVPTQTGDVNVPDKEIEKSKTTKDNKMDKVMEMFQQMMKKMDEERKARREHRKSIREILGDQNKKLEEDIKKMREDRLLREELRKDRTKEIKNYNKPETEEIPNEKTREQVALLAEIKPNRNQEDIKQREIESKKIRRIYPRNLIKTKEEMEMTNHGLIDGNNIPMTNDKDIINSRNYRRRIKVISEIIYHKAVVYHWERTRGKRNTTCGPDQFQRRTGQSIPERRKCDVLPDCDDGTDESPEYDPLEYHPGQFQGTVRLKCIPSGWICDGEPACVASDEQIINNSGVDPYNR